MIASDLPIIADRAAISFVELVEILVVSAFLSRGLPMRTIRKARRRAASKLETDHPFAYKRFKTDGRGIFIELAEESDTYRPLIELSAGQYGFPQILNRYLEQIDFDVETLMAERWWPLGRGKPIVLDPKVAFGSPVIAETRIPVSAIMDALGTGETRKSICQWYRIGSKDVAAAIAFHRGTRRHEVCI